MSVIDFDKALEYEKNGKYEEAAKIYSLAAENGDEEAMLLLGDMFENGMLDTNHKKAESYYHDLALKNNFRAQLCCGSIDKNAFESVEKDAINDDLSAMFLLGLLLERGENVGVKQNYTEAIKWYKKAAEAGNSRAMNNLGTMHGAGHGVEKDYIEAAKWYKKAAEAGDSTAMHYLGVMSYEGIGVEKDYTEAIKWYKKSAEAGNSLAMNNLGLMYDNGHGVEQDYTEAARWYKKGAEAGNSTAMNNLGLMYENGLGVEKNIKEAEKWYNKAKSEC